MTNRILDFSQTACRLRIRNECLEVASDAGVIVATVALGDIESVILSHPQISVTQATLGRFAYRGIAVVCCDERQRPVGMLLPLEANQSQRARFEAQCALSEPRKKRMWQTIVQAKICAQAQVLRECSGADYGLAAMAKRVGSGDSGNVEAQAARRYWPLLFPEDRFRRRDDEDTRNHMLNYGYAVLRAAVTRRLCGAGLHPSFALHHSSPYNTFPLADDVMEPYRPTVDRVVRLEAEKRLAAGQELALDTEAKKAVIGAMTMRYRVDGELRTLLDVISRNCQALASSIMDKNVIYSVPEWRAELRKDVTRAVSDHVDICDVRSAG